MKKKRKARVIYAVVREDGFILSVFDTYRNANRIKIGAYGDTVVKFKEVL